MNISIACITESWLTEVENHTTFRIKSYGYLVSHTHRTTGIGGGVCIIYKPNLKIKKMKYKVLYNSFEYHCITVSSIYISSELSIACIYRKQEVNFKHFQSDFLNFCEKVIESSNSYFVLLGDFNVHFELANSMSNDLESITTSMGFAQHVDSATHSSGHTLDLIFSNPYEIPIHSVKIEKTVTDSSAFKFDHFPILFSASYKTLLKPTSISKEIHVRNTKSIDIAAFNLTISNYLNENMNTSETFCETVESFNNCLLRVLDDFSPLTVKRITENINHLPIKWMDDEYLVARNQRRKLERAYNKHKNASDKQRLLLQRNVCARLAKQKMSSSLSSLINERENKSDLFKLLYKVLGKDQTSILPQCENDIYLANCFNRFYLTKIENIRQNIPFCTEQITFTMCNDLPSLHQFSPITTDDLCEIFKEMGKIKTSYLDPLPAKLLSKCKDVLLCFLVSIINQSLSEGTVEGLKQSVIKPIYKGKDLDHDVLNSYRPIFNIPFLCKLIEKVILKQFSSHIRNSCYNSQYQHGYKKFHSTETMLLEIYDEVLLGFENDYCTVLVMFDMSAAFDTVDLDVLLCILKHVLNIQGTALLWFESFLKHRSQCVKINNSLSTISESKYGVPPGSTLGPILYNVYSKGLSDVILKSGFKTSSYADDSNGRLQFMINMQYSSLSVNVPLLMRNVEDFMNKNYLKMNADKTDIMLLYPRSLSSKVINGIFIDLKSFRFSSDCKLLGVYLDSMLNFNAQVNSMISACHLKMKGIRRIRHLMSCQDAETFVRAVILSKLNYCNVLFLNLSSANMNKLQKLQNSAVRLIYNLAPRTSVSDKYQELKLLRIDQCIVFSCLVFVHKFFLGQLPQCICNLLDIQSATDRLLCVKYFSSSYAKKSFSFCAPRYWNKLPLDLRLTDNTSMFKGRLKTTLLENENNIMSATTGYYFIPR